MKTLGTFYPKDLVWYRNYQLGSKWEKGTTVKQGRIQIVKDSPNYMIPSSTVYIESSIISENGLTNPTLAQP